MTLLKDMIENIVNENETDAKVNFHSYLTSKMQNLNEADSAESVFKKIYDLRKHINKVKIDTNVSVKNKDRKISALGKSIKKAMGSYTIVLDYKIDGTQIEVPLENLGVSKLKSILNKLEAASSK